ncbi:sensor histidine kinase [Dokdonia sinensis]|uniref:Oxygen sensor histidine kinase NreB n=1 Tax=Dokdonia sinensis TaxID=2479847 RepID=A0A3M0FXB5_9FLAO|nr:sensor histidine kinase [Dokdonia sinensis]RMB57390.1 sensor histidine kinase [Dokdonia sinensis]
MRLKNLRYHISLILILASISLSFGQNVLGEFFQYSQNGYFVKAQNTLAEIKDQELNEVLRYHLDILKIGPNTRLLDDVSKYTHPESKIICKINNGIIEFAYLGNELKSFQLLRQALEESMALNNRVLACESLKYILEIYERFHFAAEDISYTYFIDTYKQLAYNEVEYNIAQFYDYRITQRFQFKNPEIVIDKYKKLKNSLEKLSSPIYAIRRDNTHFVHHLQYSGNKDSAYFYINRALDSLKAPRGFFEKERLIATQINLAAYLIDANKVKQGLDVLNKLNIPEDGFLNQSLHRFAVYREHLAYKKLGDSLSSFKYMNEFLNEELKLNQTKNIQIISEYETKYQTAQKEKQIIAEKADKERNLNIAIGLAFLLILLTIIGVLLYRNSKRNERIAEQEKAIQIQKTEKALKEKEIETINAMVSGQEKERQRLAGELHDNLGGTLAALKMHVGNIENTIEQGKSPTLSLAKMTTLLSAAYTQVRGIAHEKNSGVMAKNGLLPAIEKLANTISSSQGLQIEVQDFGLEDRLSNDLEITIFRIIQELITNIIKHSNATEATVSLTQHDKELNIMVEDNGVGFKVGKLTSSNGMGLGSIERRVEHLEGTMEVDSSPGKGTNIIIDIPL